MNTTSSIITNVDSNPGNHLLDAIRVIRTEVGDQLNEDEFTRLLRQTNLPAESGFAFLSYSDRFVTLSVPRQDLANWYTEKGWVLPAKKKIARALADKYGLSLCEPPDMAHPCVGSPNPHHHLELNNRFETLIIVHPQFLKIRLFVATSLTHDARTSQNPLFLGLTLLEELSTLYKA